ncbi:MULTISPECIES: redoxin family protein [Sphingomonas]|uniref:redoxin family protein n=1 Tax=Sphingomonas TaxID=13687 RepID=UPI000F7E5098|nr:redoxin family protein [Sphingomonas sp. ABOLF]RSV14731.1 DsbE family thiol:disulfide interchange protein [Sphingomonas sp. ABOLF]GLK19348.1 thiol:disulfide interchange protein [Microbacterium terregens]
MKRWLLWVPLAAFVVLVIVVALNLRPTDTTVRSRLVGKPLPAFILAASVPGKPGLSDAAFRDGKPKLLNVFASWCVPCLAEAPKLLRLKEAGADIRAVAIRDRSTDVQRFLAENGDPYAAIGDDPTSQVQLALGSSGVPETFVIDGKGIIRAQHIGDIRDSDVPELLRALEAAR